MSASCLYGIFGAKSAVTRSRAMNKRVHNRIGGCIRARTVKRRGFKRRPCRVPFGGCVHLGLEKRSHRRPDWRVFGGGGKAFIRQGWVLLK
eukprot:scaffold15940_cov137-Amphora_coffeaeformis.AAC.3